jgi:hypothetical protein
MEYPSDSNIEKFWNYSIQKSKRLKELILNLQIFFDDKNGSTISRTYQTQKT